MRSRLLLAFATTLISLMLVATPRDAMAQASLLTGFGGPANYGGNISPYVNGCLTPNDDGSSSAIDITAAFPGGVEFFGTTMHYTTVYVNTNGNITFNGPVSQYTPSAFPISMQPMIAPYWADVDIRPTGNGCFDYGDSTTGGGIGGFDGNGTCPANPPDTDQSYISNNVWWYLDPGPPGRFIVTWDHVGYYSCNDDHVMNFQLILTAASACGGSMSTGDFDIEFRYNVCGWEAGDASGGTDGFCAAGSCGCTPAQAGFDAGDQVHYQALPGSLQNGIAQALCTGSNTMPAQPGIWQFQVRGGTIMQCPGAGTACSTGMSGICAQGSMQCPNGGTTATCVPFTPPQPMQCNGLDNNCDGMVDNGPCPAGEICNGSMCVPVCVEGSCFAGQVCTSAGVCVDSACANVTCPAGQRCVAGSCVDACSGVTCPTGQVCRDGSCIDPCAGFSCGPSAYCVVQNGAATCVANCPCQVCATGQTCASNGQCVDSACQGMTCQPGQTCSGGQCNDNCANAVCPQGQTCSVGQCMSTGVLDGGGVDGGGHNDGGSVVDGPSRGGHTPEGGTGDGAGTSDGGIHAGGQRGCACRTAGTPASGSPAVTFLIALAFGIVGAGRRRRAVTAASRAS